MWGFGYSDKACATAFDALEKLVLTDDLTTRDCVWDSSLHPDKHCFIVGGAPADTEFHVYAPKEQTHF
jgi:hypothetical protein